MHRSQPGPIWPVSGLLGGNNVAHQLVLLKPSCSIFSMVGVVHQLVLLKPVSIGFHEMFHALNLGVVTMRENKEISIGCERSSAS
jgi:hypothetical protein